jgi:hypothetical protein
MADRTATRAGRFLALALAGLVLTSTLAACGEKPQTTLYKDGRYRGKPDNQPWNNAPTAYGSSEWAKGDQMAWQRRIDDRMRTQNEYNRIGR